MVEPLAHSARLRSVADVDITVAGNMLVGEASQTALVLAPDLEALASLSRIEVVLLE